MHVITGDLREHRTRADVHRTVERVDDVGQRREPLVLEQQRAHVIAGRQRAANHLLALGHEQPIGRLTAATQFDVCEAEIVTQPRVARVVDGHDG
jgi:hypothetical protein